MKRRAAALISTLAACGRWGFGESGVAGGANADGAIDTALDAAVASGCTDPAAADADSFDTGVGCGAWGSPIMDFTSAVVSGGGLEITSQAGHAGAQGGCIHASAPFTANGTFIEVGAVPPASTSALTGFVIDGIGGSSGKFAMYAENGLLKARDYVGVMLSPPHDPVAMRWFRLRPTNGVEFEVSPDGRTWTSVGSSPLAPPATVQITIYAGVSAAEPSPVVSRFEGVNVCPP